MSTYPSFTIARDTLTKEFKSTAHEVKTEKWQGISTQNKPEMAMRELLFRTISVPMRGLEDIEYWKKDIQPNLPFADIHWNERVSGIPSNPGEAWKTWPWGNAADAHRTEKGKFTHTYQERFWPKYAGQSEIGSMTPKEGERAGSWGNLPHSGIRYYYGDLDDVIGLLHREPLTRQAYLPIFFPEDTGAVHGGRIPCSLGYLLINRHDYLHVEYTIRSCDFVRHFNDDCYFTIRLVLYALDKLRQLDVRWKDVRPGILKMNIGSLHMFINDWNKLFDPEELKAWLARTNPQRK